MESLAGGKVKPQPEKRLLKKIEEKTRGLFALAAVSAGPSHKPMKLAVLALATLLTPELRIHLARGEMWLFKGHDALKAREEFAIVAQDGIPQGAYGMGQTYDPAVLIMVHADLAQADQGMAKAWYREAMKPR